MNQPKVNATRQKLSGVREEERREEEKEREEERREREEERRQEELERDEAQRGDQSVTEISGDFTAVTQNYIVVGMWRSRRLESSSPRSLRWGSG
jgi:hypothetical protein